MFMLTKSSSPDGLNEAFPCEFISFLNVICSDNIMYSNYIFVTSRKCALKGILGTFLKIPYDTYGGGILEDGFFCETVKLIEFLFRFLNNIQGYMLSIFEYPFYH